MLNPQAPEKGKELEDAAVRQDLLGRIEAHYKDRKMDMPIGLGSSKVRFQKRVWYSKVERMRFPPRFYVKQDFSPISADLLWILDFS